MIILQLLQVKKVVCNLINNYFVLSNHDICVIKKGSKIDIKTDNPYKIKN